jgi:hypothetical protein
METSSQENLSTRPLGAKPKEPGQIPSAIPKGALLHRIAVMFHETYAPAWPWKFTIMRLWQWPQFVALTRLAHVIFVSSERWIGQIRACTPQLACIHLPVDSNLPRCPHSRKEAQQRLGIGPETNTLFQAR